MSILDNDRGSNQVNEKGQLKKGVNFGVIPMQDLDWILTQKPSVMQLFIECWRCDPYGSRWMQLSTKLKPSAFREAKKQLANQGLFIFKRETSIQDSRSTVCWLTRNLHGSRVKDFWKAITPTELDATDTAINATDKAIDTAHTELDTTDTAAISHQSQSEQGSQNRSISFQYHVYDQQQFNIAEDGVVADSSEAGEEPTGILEEPQPDPITKAQRETVQLLDKREIFDSLRLLGIETNERVRATMKKHAANVPSAIAHIKQRYDNREKFGNITGAFVKACREGAKPRSSMATWGLDIQNNPPTEEQLQALEDARSGRLILDYFFSSLDNTYKVILLDGITQVPWWQYLDTISNHCC